MKKKIIKQFASNINVNTPIKKVWETIRIFSGNNNYATEGRNHYNEKKKETEIENAINKLAPPSTYISPNISLTNRDIVKGIWHPCSLKELKNIIKKLNPHSPPGNDLINNEAIKALPDIYVLAFT